MQVIRLKRSSYAVLMVSNFGFFCIWGATTIKRIAFYPPPVPNYQWIT